VFRPRTSAHASVSVSRTSTDEAAGTLDALHETSEAISVPSDAEGSTGTAADPVGGALSAACRQIHQAAAILGETWQEVSVDVYGTPADTFGWVVLIRVKRKTMSLGARVGALSSD